MFLTRSEYDRCVPRGEMGLGWWVGRPGAQPRPGFCRVMGRPGNPRLAQRGALLPSPPPAVVPQAGPLPIGRLALPLSHRWVLTGCGSEKLRFVPGKRLRGGTPTFNPDEAGVTPVPGHLSVLPAASEL